MLHRIHTHDSSILGKNTELPLTCSAFTTITLGLFVNGPKFLLPKRQNLLQRGVMVLDFEKLGVFGDFQEI